VCLVTPTFAATQSVTKRHITWVVRDKCKEFQTHLAGKTAVVLGVKQSNCSEVYLFFSVSCRFHYRYWWMRPYLPDDGCSKL